MDNNIFIITKEKSIRNILLCLFIIFTVIFIFYKIYIFVLIALTSLIGMICFYAQRDIKIEVTDDGIKITKHGSKFIKDSYQEFLYTDIVKIKAISSIYKSFHVIKLNNSNKSINIPRGINEDFDKFIENLSNKLSKETPNYKKDIEPNVGQIMLIALATSILPILILLMVFNNTLFTVTVIVLYSILMSIAIYYYTK